nr:hypothetical protein [Gordonibacter urolithinfaciens]
MLHGLRANENFLGLSAIGALDQHGTLADRTALFGWNVDDHAADSRSLAGILSKLEVDHDRIAIRDRIFRLKDDRFFSFEQRSRIGRNLNAFVRRRLHRSSRNRAGKGGIHLRLTDVRSDDFQVNERHGTVAVEVACGIVPVGGIEGLKGVDNNLSVIDADNAIARHVARHHQAGMRSSFTLKSPVRSSRDTASALISTCWRYVRKPGALTASS